ncbi:Receptor homology region, transmembrane domain- and RING domain-containing protein 1 [Carex littledalei]|uniref:Receptor homology region, transmembrane domain-and RING domain-containing protein 1 n=1 Tax=Carex littledalei TaxID=544730 RepID=A0A833VFE0_9POAL|nr:Receptor homology region, transmembrane domain- and RING domain-containing protein 1 [Carex littledalei]
MAFVKLKRGFVEWYLLIFLINLCLMVDLVSSNVVLMGNNLTFSFNDVEANFAPAVKGSGICGSIQIAEPLDACHKLTNEAQKGHGQALPFVLIIRGNCTFDHKVRNAQNAGYKAAIVYDNEDDGALVSMAGSSSGIKIYALFVSKSSGETLARYANRSDVEVWIIPTFENSAWSILAISFISLLAMSAVLATCFFVRRHRIRRERPGRDTDVRDFHGMSSQLVKAMPTVVFTVVSEENCTASTCAICLEDYCVGDKLRILPCRHKFHAMCVDLWLTSWRTFCPVCKRDAMAGSSFPPPPTESTPLLSSPSQSFHSNLSSHSIQIARPPRSQSISRTYTPISTPSQNPNPLPRHNSPSPFNSYHGTPRRQSPPISISRSYADFRGMSSSQSYADFHAMQSFHSYRGPNASSIHLASPHSLGYVPSSSPIYNNRYASPYNVPGSSISSSGYLVGSSGLPQSYLRHVESGTSLSGMASAQSLPQLGYLVGSSGLPQPYLQHVESGTSLSGMESAQSLPGC